MPAGGGSMTPAAARLAAALDGVGRRRVSLDLVWHCFLEAEPSFLVAASKRAHLAELLSELAVAGHIRPSRSSDGGAPPLPRSIGVGSPRGRSRRPPGSRAFPWRPELAWASSLVLAPNHFEALQAVNTFLRDGGASRPDVPARERSLQLFGDEKALDRLSRSSLFGTGRLSWEMLRCHPVHPPFVWRPVGGGRQLLVVENHHTWESLWRHLAGLADDALASGGGGAGRSDLSSVGAVAYGAGNHFIASVASAHDLPFEVEAILYFGDLDPQGLQIPVAASRVAVAAGLPAVEPARSLYRLLLEHGRRSPLDKGAVTQERATELVRWLPAGLRPPALDVLVSGRRLAQEWVGSEVLP